jgi:hypothetical protein
VVVNALDITQSFVGSLLSDNTGKVEHADSRMIMSYGQAIGLYGSPQIDKLLILEHASGATSMANGSVSVVSGVTGAKIAALGTLPNVAYDSIVADNFRYGVFSLCITPSLCDGFFHTDTAGSLVRVTNIVQ